MTRCGPPEHLHSDQVPELIADALQHLLNEARTATTFTQPGVPWQNPFANDFFAHLRDGLHDGEVFGTGRQADAVTYTYGRYCGEERPQAALNDAPPAQALLAMRAQVSVCPTRVPTSKRRTEHRLGFCSCQ